VGDYGTCIMKNDASKRARRLYARSFHAVTPIAVYLVSLLFAILLSLHCIFNYYV